MTTKTLRKLTTQATIALIAMVFLGFAMYEEIKVLYTSVSKAQILQRQGSPSSEINGITLLWFVILGATLYAICKCVEYLFGKIQEIRKVKSVLAERERQRKIEIEKRKATRQEDESERKLDSSTLRYLLMEGLKKKYKRIKITEEKWKEIEEDTESLDDDELLDLIPTKDWTW